MFRKFKPFTGPKEYHFVDPDTRYHYRAKTKEQLVTRIVQYRAQNNLPLIEELPTVIENYLCLQPENKGNCSPYKLTRGFLSYIKGGLALIQNIAYKHMVPAPVADKRAEICVKCEHNIFPDRGPFLKWADEIAEASTGGLKSKHHEELGNCAVCSCNMRAKVWYGGKLTFKKEELDRFPAFCWQLKEANRNGK